MDNFWIVLILIWFVAGVGVFIGKTYFAPKPKTIGVLKVAIDETDGEIYMSLETDPEKICTLKNGDTIILGVKIIRQ